MTNFVRLNNEYNEALLSTQDTEIESIIENNQKEDCEQSFAEEALNHHSEPEHSNINESGELSNGLENFAVEEESPPNLFSSDIEVGESNDLLPSENTEGSSEDDDLEIPAFLRRQKN